MTERKGDLNKELFLNWTIKSMLEISIPEPDSFLKIKETLTRIGVASKKDNILYQSCHILHKKGLYYIVHFKEIFNLDGKMSTLTKEDILRRNAISILLQEWKLLTILDESQCVDRSPISNIKILSFNEKSNWELQSKYSLGKTKY